MRFSSEIDDATLYELKHLRVEQGRSYVHFQVLAVARYVGARHRDPPPWDSDSEWDSRRGPILPPP